MSLIFGILGAIRLTYHKHCTGLLGTDLKSFESLLNEVMKEKSNRNEQSDGEISLRKVPVVYQMVSRSSL